MATLYGGIDLHSSNSYCGITDKMDRWVKHKRIVNRIEDMTDFFDEYKDRLEGIVLESTIKECLGTVPLLLTRCHQIGYNNKVSALTRQ